MRLKLARRVRRIPATPKIRLAYGAAWRNISGAIDGSV